MFAPRFFPKTYFAGRYFPPVSGTAPPSGPVVIQTAVITTVLRKARVVAEVEKP